MNLKNGQITVWEVLQNPKARMLLQREFPMLVESQMAGRMGNLTLNMALGYARRFVAPQKLQQLVAQLKAL